MKKRINELEIVNANIKMQLDIELNYNSKLNNEVKSKSEEIEKLNKEITKLIVEKESSNNMNKSSFNYRINDNNSNNIIKNKVNEEYNHKKKYKKY